MPWILAGSAFVAGIAVGPLLDRLAHWSLRDDSAWHRRPLATGLIAGGFAAFAVLALPEASLIPAWTALALLAAAISRTDLARHRIPDVLNAMAFTSGAVLLLLPGDLGSYGRGWLGALVVSAALLGLALVGPSGLGMGDVKLGPTLGLYLGFLGWEAVVVGVFAGFVLGALVGLALVARRALARQPVAGALRQALPFGPFLLAGTLVGLVA